MTATKGRGRPKASAENKDRIEQLCKRSARERAELCINYREAINYNQPPKNTTEEFEALERSLSRTDREITAYNLATLLKSESRELVLFAMNYNQEARRLLEELQKYAVKIRFRAEATLGLYRLLKITEELQLHAKEKAVKEGLIEIQRIINETQQEEEEEEDYTEETLEELRAAVLQFRTVTAAGRLIMKHYRHKIEMHLLHYESLEEFLTRELSRYNRYKAPEDVIDPEPPVTEEMALDIIESRIRYIDGSK
jgi:hypothetical protein